MLTIIEKVIFLQNVDVFGEVPSEDLAYLAAITEEVHYAAGEEIFRENSPSDALFLVLEGSVTLNRDGKQITQAGAKEAFGTWALFDQAPRVVTATAVSDSHLLRIDREDFYDLLSDHVEITQGVFKTVVKRMRGLMERFSPPQPGLES